MINKYDILNGAKIFSLDGSQNYLLFISTRQIYWISKNCRDSKTELWKLPMPEECIDNPQTSDISFAPKLIGDYQFQKVEFKGICLKQDSVSFLHRNAVNLYILIN